MTPDPTRTVCSSLDRILNLRYWQLLLTWPARAARGQCRPPYRALDSPEYRLEFLKELPRREASTDLAEWERRVRDLIVDLDQRYGPGYVGAREARHVEMLEEFENQYGDRHYGDRRQRLGACLNYLVEQHGLSLVEEVCHVLEAGKETQEHAYREGFRLDHRREWIKARDRHVGTLRAGAKGLRDFLVNSTRFGPGHRFQSSDMLDAALQTRELSTIRTLDAVLAMLDTDPTCTVHPPGPRRRSKGARRPPEPWTRTTRETLAGLGIKPVLQNELLITVGLTTKYKRRSRATATLIFSDEK